ncbi:MAG TPA: extensin family protein [Polyangiaceae bacterium]|nr:extensin family protein [Polyangiaceae bacterium]
MLLLCCFSSGACAREARAREPLSPYIASPPPIWTPAPYEDALAWSAAGYSKDGANANAPVMPGEYQDPSSARRGDRAPVLSGRRGAPPSYHESARIPGGEACLELLDDLPVKYRRIDDKRGVVTPVEVTGPVAGIRYHAGAGLPFVCDCRLAVALAWLGPELKQLGVTDVRYSGVYVYRLSRVGRLSLHAYGHAIDLHEFRTGGERHVVKGDYRVGLSDPCARSAPLLNQVACRVKRLALFKEVLTPDYNADHHDHFHLGLAPLEQPQRVALGARGRRVVLAKQP